MTTIPTRRDIPIWGFAEAVDERGYVQITQRNKFTVGETIEIMKPDGTNLLVPVKAIYDEEGNSVESAPHPQQKLFVDLGGGAEGLRYSPPQ